MAPPPTTKSLWGNASSDQMLSDVSTGTVIAPATSGTMGDAPLAMMIERDENVWSLTCTSKGDGS